MYANQHLPLRTTLEGTRMPQHDQHEPDCPAALPPGTGETASDAVITNWAAGPAEALTYLLDLHRRGVIDDAAFAGLSRNLATDPAAAMAGAAVAAATGARARLGPPLGRSAMIAALTTALILLAGGVTWALLLGTANRAALTASPGAQVGNVISDSSDPAPLIAPECATTLTRLPANTDVPHDQAAPRLTAEGCEPAGLEPDPANVALAQVATPKKVAEQTAPAPARPAPTTAPARPRAPVPAAVAAPAPATVPAATTSAPVVAPPPTVNCSSYRYSLSDLRSRYAASLANNNIALNKALSSGNLDEAARLQANAAALAQRQSLEESRLKSQYPGC